MFLRGKKGKYTDVEGYNRISRLIEDRQREVTGSVEDDTFDEEGVLLSREPASRERTTRSADERQPAAARSQPQPSEDRPPAVQPQPGPAPTTADERRIPFQPGIAETQQVNTMEPPTLITETLPPAAPVAMERPRMVPTDLGAASMQGSLVAADAVWEGKLLANGNLRVEGTVHGEVQTSGTLFVAANARIDGTIQARSILLAGEIEGQVRCGERLEILAGGSARGEIETATLVVHEGAFIDSRFQMRQPEAAGRR